MPGSPNKSSLYFRYGTAENAADTEDLRPLPKAVRSSSARSESGGVGNLGVSPLRMASPAGNLGGTAQPWKSRGRRGRRLAARRRRSETEPFRFAATSRRMPGMGID